MFGCFSKSLFPVKSSHGQTNILFLFCLSSLAAPSLSKRRPYTCQEAELSFEVSHVLRQLVGQRSHVVESHHAFHVAGSSLLELTHH